MASARVNAYGSLMEVEDEMPQQDALEETSSVVSMYLWYSQRGHF